MEKDKDAISRTDVRHLIAEVKRKSLYSISSKAFKELYNGIDDLQPVTTEPKTDYIAHGTDGNFYKLTISNGKEFEPEPCEDAISRQAVLDLIEHYNSDGLGSVFYGYEEGVKFANAVNKLPPIKQHPKSKTGHWIKRPHGFKCSRCLIVHSNTSLYCPSCGAKMIE